MDQLEFDFGDIATEPPGVLASLPAYSETGQMELFFPDQPREGQNVASPLEDWKARRAAARESLNPSLGLPVGKKVEIVLNDGLRLRGLLELFEGEGLWIEEKPRGEAIAIPLSINKTDFTAWDVASCRIIE